MKIIIRLSFYDDYPMRLPDLKWEVDSRIIVEAIIRQKIFTIGQDNAENYDRSTGKIYLHNQHSGAHRRYQPRLAHQ
jgi:hypothetical protein